MQISVFIGLLVFAYLLGSVPWGLILTRFFARNDIRLKGSGNIGATNVAREAGALPGLLTLAGDVIKGALPVYLACSTFGPPGGLGDPYLAAVALVAFAGHLFPVYLKFRDGGKGVATALGVFIILEPVAVLISLFLFTGIVYVSGFVSVGSLLVSALMTLWIWLLGGSPNHVFLAFFIAVFIWLKHMDNINRLLAGTEKSWKNKKDR